MRRPDVRIDEWVMRVRWKVRCAWARVAWPDLMALAAVGFWISLVLWVNIPLRQELRALHGYEKSSSAATSGFSEARKIDTQEVASPSAWVDAFLAFLPSAELREQQLQTLHALARESGVELTRVEYGHGSLEHLPGRRLTMQLSILAEYGAYRRYLHKLLVSMPNLAVDRLTTEGAAEQPDRLNVRMEASLYYRNNDAAGP